MHSNISWGSRSTQLPDAFDYVVVGQVMTRYVTAERHDYHFGRPQRTIAHLSKGFLDLALSHRPKNCIGAFVDEPRSKPSPIGDLLYIPPHQALQSQWDAGQQKSICCEFQGNVDQDRVSLGWSMPELEASLDVRSVVIRSLMQKLATEVEKPGFASSLMVEALGLEISVELERYLRSAREARVSECRFSRTQMQLVEDMIENSEALPSIAELSAACGISARHFFRMFRKTTSMTLTDFATERRLHRAKGLLCDRKLLIKEISYRCGFSNSAAFSAAFRRATGISPREYRQSLKN